MRYHSDALLRQLPASVIYPLRRACVTMGTTAVTNIAALCLSAGKSPVITAVGGDAPVYRKSRWRIYHQSRHLSLLKDDTTVLSR